MHLKQTLLVNPSLEQQLIALIITRCSPNSTNQKIPVTIAQKYVPKELTDGVGFKSMILLIGREDRHFKSLSPQQETAASFGYVSFCSKVPYPTLPPLSKYECLIDRNTDNNRPEDFIQQTFFGELVYEEESFGYIPTSGQNSPPHTHQDL